MNLNKYKTELLALSKKISQEIIDSKDTVKPPELDQTTVGRLSRMDAIQNQQIALERERRRKQKILQIDAALKRIESEDFGYCLKCDEEIEVARLAFDPTVTLCKKCMV